MYIKAFIANIICIMCISISTTGSAAEPVIQQVYPRIELVTFYSEILHTAKSFSAVLPENYDQTQTNWPVLFIFHGRGRTERSLIDDAVARESLLSASFVIILPDGDDGWYIDSPEIPADRYQTYTEEVVSQAGDIYKLSTDREQRALAGWSMGGYGCTFFAENHAQEFSVVAPIIGLLDFPRTGLPDGQSYEVPTDRFGSDPAVWATLNPINFIDNLRQTSIYVVMADEAFDRTMNENFIAALSGAGISYESRMLSGGHTFDVVCEALPLVINHVTKSFKPVTVLPPVKQGLIIGLDGANVTSVDGKVQYWNNQINTSQSDDFFQDTPSYRPLLLTNALMPDGHSHNLIDFDGTNQFLVIDTCDALSTNTVTTFAVVRADTMEDDRTGYILSTYDSAVRWGSGERSGNNMWFTLTRKSSGDAVIPNLTGIIQDQWYILSMSWNGVTGDVFSRSLGRDCDLKLNSSTGVFNTSRPHVRTRIGSNADISPNYFFNGQLAEILIYNRALTASEMESNESYLTRKYFLNINKGITLLVQ